jgi:hypothetical protein
LSNLISKGFAALTNRMKASVSLNKETEDTVNDLV